jgi:hypothetical protein
VLKLFIPQGDPFNASDALAGKDYHGYDDTGQEQPAAPLPKYRS